MKQTQKWTAWYRKTGCRILYVLFFVSIYIWRERIKPAKDCFTPINDIISNQWKCSSVKTRKRIYFHQYGLLCVGQFKLNISDYIDLLQFSLSRSPVIGRIAPPERSDTNKRQQKKTIIIIIGTSSDLIFSLLLVLLTQNKNW